MMGSGSNHKTSQMHELSMSGDLMTFRQCPLQYRCYNVLGLPRSNKDPLWNSEFICELEREAYHQWRSTGRKIKDRQSIGLMSRQVDGFLRSQGMRPHPKTYEDDVEGISGKLMNLRAHETVCFLMDHLFPLVTENDAVFRYCDDRMPFSMTGSAGVMDGNTILNAESSNVLAQIIKQSVESLSSDSKVIFEIRGTERPLQEDEGSNKDSHTTYIHALMGMRMSDNDEAGRIAAGVILYLNELRLSKRARKALYAYLEDSDDDDDIDILLELEDGEQPSIESRMRRCIRVVPYDSVSSRKAINDMSRIGMEIIRAHQSDEEDPSAVRSHWEPGNYDERRCKECDLALSCASVPDENKGIVTRCGSRILNEHPSMMAPRE